MKKTLLRLVALALALALPVIALADHGVEWEYEADTAFSYTVDSITLTPENFPAVEQDVLSGVKDLLDITALKGDFAFLHTDEFTIGNTFRLRATLELNGDADSDTQLELYGVDSHYYVESSLLGSSRVMLNIESLLEFAMKAYYHLELPLQYTALLVAPYATTGAFQVFSFPAQELLKAEDGLISRENVVRMAEFVEDVVNNPLHARLYDWDALDEASAAALMASYVGSAQSFNGWLTALLTENGLLDEVKDFLGSLSTWAEKILGDSEGIRCTAAEGRTVWQAGDTVLLTETDAGWSLTLPDVLEGCGLTVTLTREEQGLRGEISWKSEERTLLEGSLQLQGIPEALPFQGKLRGEISLTGEACGTIDLGAEITGEGDAWSLSVFSASEPEKQYLAAAGTWQDCRPSMISFYYDQGDDPNTLNLLSVNDTTLPQFINSVKSPLIRGALKLGSAVPASTYESLFRFLERYNILDVLSGGFRD